MSARRRRSRPGILLLALVLVALLGVAVWAAAAGLGARGDLLTVRTTVTDLRHDPPESAAELRDRLRPAAAAARRARVSLGRPGPALVTRLPLLGQPLAVERDLALLADELLETATAVATDLDGFEVGASLDTAALQRIAGRLRQAGDAVQDPSARLRASALTLLPGATRADVAELQVQLVGLDRRLLQAGDATSALAGLLGSDGPRDLVVLLMNNAELRGSGGYAGSFALVRTEQGEVSIQPFADVNEVQDPPASARRVPAPEGYEARWGGFLANSTLWKNTLMSADQPTSADVTCAVVRLAPGAPCDAVVLLDVPVLARLVELSGPLDLGGGQQATGADLVEALLVEAYAETGATAGDQALRRDRLRTAADAAVGRLLGRGLGGVEVLDVLRVLSDAVRGRHLALWSSRQEEQVALQAVGFAGSVDPHGGDINLVSINQMSAGKLDYYVTRSVGLLAVVDEQHTDVTQKVTLSLDVPAGLPPYVLGVRGGRLEELMDIALAPDARDVELRRNGRPEPVVLAAESGSLRVAVDVVLGDGDSVTWEVSYRVPLEDGAYRLRVLPQPLARDAVLHLAVVAAPGRVLRDGDVRYDGPFDRTRSVVARIR